MAGIAGMQLQMMETQDSIKLYQSQFCVVVTVRFGGEHYRQISTIYDAHVLSSL